jgi:hypothetical protein
MRGHNRQSRVTVWLLGLCAACALAASPAPELGRESVTDEEFRVPVDASAAAELDRLIPMLSSPRFEEREEATAALMDLGVPAIARLREAYRNNDDFELRSRIETIVRETYMDKYVGIGFLGISQDTQFTPGHQDDPRIPPGHVGVIINQVIPGTGAERAGLLRGDIVIAMDGVPLDGQGQGAVEGFGARIRAGGPRARVVLSILRGPMELELPAVLGRPKGDMLAPGRIMRVNAAAATYRAQSRFEIWWHKFFRQDESPPARLNPPGGKSDQDS